MRHISSKDDWYYEFKPTVIQSIGVFGIVLKLFMADSGYSNLALVCGLVLLGIGWQISKWRREYRAKSFMR